MIDARAALRRLTETVRHLGRGASRPAPRGVIEWLEPRRVLDGTIGVGDALPAAPPLPPGIGDALPPQSPFPDQGNPTPTPTPTPTPEVPPGDGGIGTAPPPPIITDPGQPAPVDQPDPPLPSPDPPGSELPPAPPPTTGIPPHASDLRVLSLPAGPIVGGTAG